MNTNHSQVVLDIRSAATDTRNAFVFAVVDRLLEIDGPDSVLVISDHDLSSLCYQLDLRPESRGRFDYDSSQRLDGAWAALIRRHVE
jgi:uncharacterized protein (DUF2249 family)